MGINGYVDQLDLYAKGNRGSRGWICKDRVIYKLNKMIWRG